MFELAVLLSVAAIIATAWLLYKDHLAPNDHKRIQGKTRRLESLERSVKQLSEDLKDV